MNADEFYEMAGMCWNCGCKRIWRIIENVVGNLIPDVPDGPNAWQTFVICGNCGKLRKIQETRWWGPAISSVELQEITEKLYENWEVAE